MNGNNATDKALRGRFEEFVKFRRDMTARCAEAGGAAEAGTEQWRRLLCETEELQQFAAAALQEITAIDTDSWPEEQRGAALATAMKQLNDCRLELIRRSNRLEEMAAAAGSRGAAAPSTAPALELASLSFGQLLRLGLIVTLPVATILTVGLLLIAVAVYLSTRI
ncbi:MAG: hypothetical protein PHQ27_10370 [Victivallales bacterium]|nr:hypothetical protein [Victivallales bacterium]